MFHCLEKQYAFNPLYNSISDKHVKLLHVVIHNKLKIQNPSLSFVIQKNCSNLIYYEKIVILQFIYKIMQHIYIHFFKGSMNDMAKRKY